MVEPSRDLVELCAGLVCRQHFSHTDKQYWNQYQSSMQVLYSRKCCTQPTLGRAWAM